MTHDERLAWLKLRADCGCPDDLCEHVGTAAPDEVTAAALRIADEFGWWYDPPLSPETVLRMAELAQLAPWHFRDDVGRVWEVHLDNGVLPNLHRATLVSEEG